jgi:hypothetical protein
MHNNSSLQKWNRLRVKNLDSQFEKEVLGGLDCSPIEAKAMVEVVHKIYGRYFDTSGSIKTGQILFEVISETASPALSLKESPMIEVLLTLDAGIEDLQIKERSGVTGLRRYRLQRIAIEAHQQGGLLTVEDIANRLLNCGERTICRDIAALKQRGIILPLRSTVKDMGRSISHRAAIVKQYLLGKEYSEIGRITNHSIMSVDNYVEKFKRVIALKNDGFDKKTISFLVKLSLPLVDEYIKIYKSSEIIDFRRTELTEYLKKSTPITEKKRRKR